MATQLLFYPDGTVLKTTDAPLDVPDNTICFMTLENGQSGWIRAITVPYRGNLNNIEWCLMLDAEVSPEYKVRALLMV